MRRLVTKLVLVLSLCLTVAAADDRPNDPKTPTGRFDEVIVTDLDGQEHRLTGVAFSTGTRRLTWLADPHGSDPDSRSGPLALAFREPNSTTYVNGVLTLVPLRHVESLRYDYERQLVTLSVKGAKEPLIGSLEYAGVNVLGITGRGDGQTRSFSAGVRGQAAVRAVTFLDPVPVPQLPPGAASRGWSVRLVVSKKTAGPEPPPLVVRDLKPFVVLPGGAGKRLDGLPRRKGPPLTFDAHLKRFEVLALDLDRGAAAAEIETADGSEQLVVIPLINDAEKPAATLAGLLGEVEVGYKLFPLHTVRTITPYERKVD